MSTRTPHYIGIITLCKLEGQPDEETFMSNLLQYNWCSLSTMKLLKTYVVVQQKIRPKLKIQIY